MSNKKKQFDQEFKQNAVNYCLTHPELSRKECAKNLGIGDSTLYRWKQEAKANNNQATFKGSGNLTEAELENRRLKRELKDTQDALEILKKAIRITQVLYCLVSEESKVDKDFSVTGVLSKLHLSKSGYYNYLHRKPSKQSISKKNRIQTIQAIYDDNHQIYGAPKIAKEMQKQGEKISERTVGVYMREMGIKACYIKPYVKTTFDSDFSTKLHNILKRDFSPSKPNEAWCTDITYIFTLEGFVYLTSVMDLYSRKIIAWTLSKTLEVEEVLKCIEMARKRRKTADPVIIHSDRGVHYTSKLYKKLTEGLILSYSKKGTPWDNACIESFHSVIKREWLNRTLIYDYDHAYDLCFEYIETFYNTIRIHSHCGYESPNQYENNYYSKH